MKRKRQADIPGQETESGKKKKKFQKLSNESLRGSWRTENRKETQSLGPETGKRREITGRKTDRCRCEVGIHENWKYENVGRGNREQSDPLSSQSPVVAAQPTSPEC